LVANTYQNLNLTSTTHLLLQKIQREREISSSKIEEEEKQQEIEEGAAVGD